MLDRISNLLIHILYFLPTKESMATSILSKRWKLLWSLVPKLEINKFCESADHFSRFFDLHKAPYLRTCRITYDFADCCFNLVDTWVNNVAAREGLVGYDAAEKKVMDGGDDGAKVVVSRPVERKDSMELSFLNNENEKPPTSVRFAHRKAVKASPEGSNCFNHEFH